ncbi:MFS transporter [Arthrobacter sp. W4I7]|uniref:MFS transporter n=1 Tax=Arthrobacter sp. W4I7 TaxID=3042296 RepID=UPI002786D9E5|nr:MFS transporter [Arthrobacter sp. W4I7]MDQ0691258.1 DHA1 family inner membrane transport protein [Arthrobacter sp. W4I7]
MTSSAKPDQAKQPAARGSQEKFPLYGLLALSAAIFISMATEFLPGGLIPLIAEEFGRPPSELGSLITVFALTVMLSTVPLAILTRRVPRKTMVLIAFAFIGIGNLATFLSPTFEFLLAARVLGALAHGAFWSVVAAYPAHLVGHLQLGKATAITAAGGSVSGVLGIPLGNALGQAFGWRTSFAVLAAFVLVVCLLMAWKLPAIAKPAARSEREALPPVRQDPTLLAVLVVCLLILLVVAAQVSFGTFSVVWLLDVVHIPPAVVPVMLFCGGVASALGVALTGALYSRFPVRLFLGALVVLVGLLCAMPVAAGFQPAVWILSAAMGAVFGGVPVMLQTRMMWTASPRARNVAAALQTTAFNVGIAGGAFMGGIAIEQSSIEALPFWGATAMFVALAVAVLWELRTRQTRDTKRSTAVQ